ncbi:hypothetical protein MICAI_180002 [Microcystis sp. T1-4]|nr:hypothetical protein MICAI_180002 [Microcystis sp. T1-4]
MRILKSSNELGEEDVKNLKFLSNFTTHNITPPSQLITDNS